MKIIEKSDATRTLAEYAEEIESGPVVLTSHGDPVAVLMQIENADLETVSLSTSRKFLDIIENSQACIRAQGGITSQEMRRRFE